MLNRSLKPCAVAFVTVLAMSAPVAAQMTDASTIRPILEATKTSWIGVREWEGQDLLYFTHLETWKCGLTEIRYGINSDVADEVFAFEVCAEDEAAPSPISADRLPYLTFAPGLIETVTITLIYDDGAEQTEHFDRAEVKIP